MRPTGVKQFALWPKFEHYIFGICYCSTNVSSDTSPQPVGAVKYCVFCFI